MIERVTLKEVYNVYKKWLNVSDTRRIDIGLAVALTREVIGTKLWLIFIGNSGDWKSEQLNALDDSEEINGKIRYNNIRKIEKLTSKTLINGSPNVPDLAPELKDKIVLIPEMAQLLKLHPNEKGEVWAQLRNLYDGTAQGDSGMGARKRYSNLNVTLMAGSTPAIDSQILIHQDLGSRELIWRTSIKDVYEDNKSMDDAWSNEEKEENMREELKEITIKFLNTNKYDLRVKIDDEIKEKLKIYCHYLSFMRSPAEIDSYTGELLNDAHPEKPTRLIKQIKRLFIALKSLDSGYSDEKALSVISYVIQSSSFQNRVKVLNFLFHQDNEIGSNKVSKDLKIGNKTIQRELNILWNLNIVNRREEEYENFGKLMERHYWSINKEHSILKMVYPSSTN